MKIKKFIPVIMALCIGVAVVSGCTAESKDEYDALNALLTRDYSQIVLTVTNTFGEDCTLTSEYIMKFSDAGMTVNYSVERFSEVSLDYTASAKTEIVGEAIISDGKITYVQGDEVNLDEITAGSGLNFKKEYFANAELESVYLIADVTNPSGFMGSEITCSEMKVSATFPEMFYNIHITYLAENGNHVEYLYTFSV